MATPTDKAASVIRDHGKVLLLSSGAAGEELLQGPSSGVSIVMTRYLAPLRLN